MIYTIYRGGEPIELEVDATWEFVTSYNSHERGERLVDWETTPSMSLTLSEVETIEQRLYDEHR